MNDVVIQVNNLSKEYKIGAIQNQPDMFRDWLIGRFRRSSHDARDESLWALKDVSFEVKRGEVVGIIGRNGAGKSTLLKILSRITEPTSGRIEMDGRVGSLLEVGTGFHPELTGRENVYLSGAILGMRRLEINERFDEIVAFSGIERFIDTPFKRYSSGMKVRLGFAVAAHLEPEILLIDEVLAVGDLAFQKKCLGKMSEVAGEGRTVIFISHNMASIRRLCSRALWLFDGDIREAGNVESVTDSYTTFAQESVVNQKAKFPIVNNHYRIGITTVEVKCEPSDQGTVDLHVTLNIQADEKLPVIGVGMAIFSIDGVPLSIFRPSITNFTIKELIGQQRCSLVCSGINHFISGGSYIVSVWLSIPNSEYLVKVEDAASFSLPAMDVYSTGIGHEARRHGIIPLEAKFYLD